MRRVEVRTLRRLARSCASSAAAYKAAYMLAAGQDAETRLLDRCTARYASLEHLIELLRERGMTPKGLRAMLRHTAREQAPVICRAALTEAEKADRLMRDILTWIPSRPTLAAALVSDLAPLRCELGVLDGGPGGSACRGGERAAVDGEARAALAS